MVSRVYYFCDLIYKGWNAELGLFGRHEFGGSKFDNSSFQHGMFVIRIDGNNAGHQYTGSTTSVIFVEEQLSWIFNKE